MEKIFDVTIERYKDTSTNRLIEIAENSLKYAKTDAIICLAQRIEKEKEKIIKSFDNILSNENNFKPVSMNLPYNFLILIVLIENLKKEDYKMVQSRFNTWKDSDKKECIAYLKDYPNHIAILEN